MTDFDIERTFTKNGTITMVIKLSSGKRININMGKTAFDSMDEDELEYRISRTVEQYDQVHETKTKEDAMWKVERCNQRIKKKRAAASVASFTETSE